VVSFGHGRKHMGTRESPHTEQAGA
jgi:hypothetical protein